MGGGASSMSSPLEQLLITTMMIGRAIAAISCPGMYTIYDFHSSKAPRLKLNGHLANNPFAILQQGYNANDEDDEDDDDEGKGTSKRKDPQVYNNMFTVQVGEDKIYIENVLHSNESGWLPLHACCMSLVTLDAGLRIIDEMLLQERLLHNRSSAMSAATGTSATSEEKKESTLSTSVSNNTGVTHQPVISYLDLPTKSGPGAFNSQWTPLHMACAYGVEPLVTRLLEEGVNINTQNSYGYTPLLEACRRGYVDIVQRLLGDRYLDVNHLPNSELASESPFSTAPPQRPLAEATRAGFITVVQLLLDDSEGRVQINASNSIGWTALHEACFYNRREIVQLLLLKAADPTARTAMSHAMPYHLTSDGLIQQLLVTLGGSLAVPTDTDKIDMLTVLEELASFKNIKNNSNSNTMSKNSNNNNYSNSSNKNNRQMVVYHSSSNGRDDDDDDDDDGRDATVAITNMILNQLTLNGNHSNNSNNTNGNNTNEHDDDDDDGHYMTATPPRNRLNNNNSTNTATATATNDHREYYTTPAEIPHSRAATATVSITNSNNKPMATTVNISATITAGVVNDERKSSSSLLGNLPLLSSPTNNSNNNNNNNNNTRNNNSSINNNPTSSSPRQQQQSSPSVSLTADAKPFMKRAYHNNNNNNNNTTTTPSSSSSSSSSSYMNNHTTSSSEVPKSFVCELSHKIMTDPVRSIYGNVYERSVIAQWIDIHGKICPLTGAPLCITDLTASEELSSDIRHYLLTRATATSGRRRSDSDTHIDHNNNGDDNNHDIITTSTTNHNVNMITSINKNIQQMDSKSSNSNNINNDNVQINDDPYDF